MSRTVFPRGAAPSSPRTLPGSATRSSTSTFWETADGLVLVDGRIPPRTTTGRVPPQPRSHTPPALQAATAVQGRVRIVARSARPASRIRAI